MSFVYKDDVKNSLSHYNYQALPSFTTFAGLFVCTSFIPYFHMIQFMSQWSLLPKFQITPPSIYWIVKSNSMPYCVGQSNCQYHQLL